MILKGNRGNNPKWFLQGIIRFMGIDRVGFPKLDGFAQNIYHLSLIIF